MQIGIDIENINRFSGLTLEKDLYFFKNIFTDIELRYSFADKRTSQHLCARFCAKEATIKALYALGIKNVKLNEIEIWNDENNVPKIKIKNYESLKVKVSLSHTKDNAIAVVLIEN